MSLRQNLADAIADLRRIEGADLPSPDADGITAFAVTHEGVTSEIYVRAFEEGDMVSLMCPVGSVEVPPKDAAAIHQGFLAAGCLGLETNGLSLFLNPGDGRLCLGYSIFGNMLTGEALGEVIGRIHIANAVWKERLSATP